MAGRTASRPGWSGARWRIAAWGAAAALLLAPLVAMQLTDEVDWTAFDFVFAAVLLGGVGAAFELAVRWSRSGAARVGHRAPYRAGAGVALAAALLLVWVTGAVGIIGAEGHDANLLYAGVLAVALGGAVLARFRPAGLARAMLATALAQAAVAAAALLAGWGSEIDGWWLDIVGVTALFVAMWVAAAWLFWRAAEQN